MFICYCCVLFFNIFGLLPYGYALTAHIIITFFFAFGFNLGLIFLGFYKYKLFFFKLFIPTGVPKFLIFFFFLFDLISYLFRTFILFISILCIYLILFILELGVGFLQAYVFIVLICIYINDSVNLVH